MRVGQFRYLAWLLLLAYLVWIVVVGHFRTLDIDCWITDITKSSGSGIGAMASLDWTGSERGSSDMVLPNRW